MTTIILPHNADLEKKILCCCLTEPEMIKMLSLEVGDFFIERHRLLWSCMRETVDQWRDIAQLVGILRDRMLLDKCGGAAYISSLIESWVPVHWLPSLVKTLKGYTQRRLIMQTANGYMQKAQNYTGDNADDLLAEFEASMSRVTRLPAQTGPVHIRDAMKTALQHIEDAWEKRGADTAIMTGFNQLDEKTGGLRRGVISILAGRPGMGKSALAVQMILTACRNAINVLLFGIEDPREDTCLRYLCLETGCTLNQLRSGTFNEIHWTDIVNAAGKVTAWPWRIDDSSILKSSDVWQRVERQTQEGGVDLVVIDHLQELREPGRFTSSHERYAQIVSNLRAIAKEFNVAVLLLSQLNRGVEARTSHHPTLADLKETGKIEEAARLVMMIYRPDYYDASIGEKQPARLYIRKHTHGATGYIPLIWMPRIAAFREPAPDEQGMDDEIK